jgi:hypothetical protein
MTFLAAIGKRNKLLMEVITRSIDLSYLENIRKEMPLWDQRRPEVYGKINNHAQ